MNGLEILLTHHARFTISLFYIITTLVMKVREVIKRMENDGWARKKGSHRQYKHPYTKGVVTISGHLKGDSAKGDS
jgi:predicted RNA binding protein YcfA (HicA-like mRNA interferase family)